MDFKLQIRSGSTFSPKQKIVDKRNVLVRIIKSTDDDVRDRIIRATNRQTPIGPSQLRATEQLHRDIEGFFKARGKYYEKAKKSVQECWSSKARYLLDKRACSSGDCDLIGEAKRRARKAKHPS